MLCVIVAQHSNRPVFSPRITLLHPVLRILFQVPYPVSPVFATLMRTAGVCTNNSYSETNLLPVSNHQAASTESAFTDRGLRLTGHSPLPRIPFLFTFLRTLSLLFALTK